MGGGGGGGGKGGCGYYDHAFNFHPSFSSASFPLFLFSFGYSGFFFFGFLHHCHCETTPLQEDIITHTSGVRTHYIVLHLVSSRASRTSGLCVQFIYHSWLVDYRNIGLDFRQRRYFGFGSKACICFVNRSRHIYFTSWLNNIDEFRCSTAEIASITTMFWTLSTILCQVYAGYLYHHPWSETQQTGYSMEVTVSLR